MNRLPRPRLRVLLISLLIPGRSLFGISFSPAVSYPVGIQPTTVAVADFNGDGKLDLAVATNGAALWVLIGNGDGTFQSAVGYSVPPSNGIAVGDFNADGKLDLATPSYSGNNVSILNGNGDGTFQPAVSYPAGINPVSVASADFDGDGKLDLVVANFGPPSLISILRGNGNGTFQGPIAFPTALAPSAVAVGDFNRDGKMDVAVSAYAGSNTVAVHLGNGDGTFQPPVYYSTLPNLEFVTAADLRRNGKLDLVVTADGSNTLAVLLGNGDGTFKPPVSYSTGRRPVSIAVGDFDRDGKLDLAVANDFYPDNDVSILSGNGDGTFQSPINFGAGFNPISVAVGDFNRDGRLDLAVANNSSNNVSVLLNATALPVQVPAMSRAAAIALTLFLASIGLFALLRRN